MVPLDRTRAGHPVFIGKGCTHRLAQVVIAGDRPQRHLKRREQLAQTGVFLGAAVIRQISGQNHTVNRIQQWQPCIYGLDRTDKRGGGIRTAICEAALRDDMRVGELNE